MISCEKAAIICNKTQYREATFTEKLKLRYHLLMCKACSKATKQNTQLTTLCQKADLHSLTEQEKLKMKQILEKGD